MLTTEASSWVFTGRGSMVTVSGLLVSVLALATLVGCGTGGSLVLNPPTGSFSKASVKGSYVYQIHGVSVVNGVVYREVGVFTADGAGAITGGSDDSSANPAGAAVSGTYTVSPDGTGFINMSTSLGQVNLALTIVSSGKLDLIESDNTLNAAGAAELQDSTAISARPNGTFVFRLHQEASAQSQNTPSSQLGALTLTSGSGTGTMDQNLGGTLSTDSLAATFNSPGSLGRGTGNFFDSTASFTTSFVYYTVSNSKIVFLVTNPSSVGSGSAEVQTGTLSSGLAGNYAFGSRGDDAFSLDGLATVGQFTANSGSISGVEDVMQDGTFSPNVTLSECYSSQTSGRVVVTNCSSTTPTQVFWMVNPSRAFFFDINGTAVQDGTADLQTASSFTVATVKGQFAMVMDGIDLTPELLSRVGVLQFDGTQKAVVTELINSSASLSGG
ncbi:MAG: hypothetical protein JO356_05315, partial [Acidobacteria bacterium]|nr:hypothetical protein [Acidobacteriota bacterium]